MILIEAKDLDGQLNNSFDIGIFFIQIIRSQSRICVICEPHQVILQRLKVYTKNWKNSKDLF